MEALERPLRHQVLILASPERTTAVVPLVAAAGLRAVAMATAAEVLAYLRAGEGREVASVVCALGVNEETNCWPVLQELCERGRRQVFSIVLSHTAATHVRRRLECFQAGARMVTQSEPAVGQALGRVAAALRSAGPYACPACGLGGLSEDALREHLPLYHGAEPNPPGPCPICGDPCARSNYLPVHLWNEHGPEDMREPPQAPYPAFAWCVCRRESDGKFLLVNEPAGICSSGKPGYWLPAGRVDRGESLQEAAQRECLEEAGVATRVVGVLRFIVDNSRCPEVMRVVFLTTPTEGADAEPKSIPDFESVGALWVAADDLRLLQKEDYRSTDPARLYPRVASGELRPQPTDTSEFQALEALVRRLTLGDPGAEAELPGVWRALQAAYPAAAFSSSG